MVAVYRHYEIKQKSNFLLIAHVLAHSEGHARRIYEDVTGADHKLVKTYMIVETTIPPHEDTILPGDAHKSRTNNALYRDQIAKESDPDPTPERMPMTTTTALLTDLKSVRIRLSDITVINKSINDRDEALRLLNVVIRSLETSRDAVTYKPKDSSVASIEQLIRNRGVNAAESIVLMIDEAEQRGYDDALKKRDEEREACAVTAWSVGMRYPEGDLRDVAMSVVSRIRGRGEAYPKKDVVMMPRALAEAAEAGTILPPEHIAVPKNLAERILRLLPFQDGHAETSTIAQYRDIVFPKVTKTVTIEVTGAESDVDNWIGNLDKDGHAAVKNLVKIDKQEKK